MDLIIAAIALLSAVLELAFRIVDNWGAIRRIWLANHHNTTRTSSNRR